MTRALNLHQDTSNNHLLMDSGHDNHSCINLPYCEGPNQVDSRIDLQEASDFVDEEIEFLSFCSFSP